MKNRLLAAASAAVLSLALAAGAVSAQDLAMKQLQDSALLQFSELGLDPGIIDSLTLEELTQIQTATSDESSEQGKVQRVNTIIAGAEERLAQGGAATTGNATVGATTTDAGGLDSISVVKETVRQNLSELGMLGEVDVDSLTDDQLMQIQLISSGQSEVDQQRQQIEEIISSN